MNMFYNPYQYNNMQYPQQQSQQVLRVNGENGAKMLTLPPNSSALALDENAPIVWLCQTDGAGYKTCTPYKIEPYQQQPQSNITDLEMRVKRLEEMLTNATKSNFANDEPERLSVSNDTAVQPVQANNARKKS